MSVVYLRGRLLVQGTCRGSLRIFPGCTNYGVYTVKRFADRKIRNSVIVTFDKNSPHGLDNDISISSGEEKKFEPSHITITLLGEYALEADKHFLESGETSQTFHISEKSIKRRHSNRTRGLHSQWQQVTHQLSRGLYVRLAMSRGWENEL